MVSGLVGGIAGGATVAIIIKAIDQFSGIFAKANKGMLLLGGAMTAVGIAGLGLAAGLVKVAGQFEQTNIAFTTMLGNAEEAKKLLKELADFATKTPFTIVEVEQNAKLLMAMGIETEKLLPTLKALGDVSAGLSVPLQRIALNFGQVRTQGKLTGRELRDFNVAGVPLIAELSKTLGKSEKQIKDMVSAGKIGFKEVEAAFISMTSEGGKFYDLMDAQSKTFLGQMSNIQDSLTKIGRVMGEILLPIAKKFATALQVIIGFMEEHPTISKMAVVLLAVSTALALIVGPTLIFAALLPSMVAGITLLTAVSLPWLGTVLLIGAAIAALIAVGILLWKNWDIVKEKGIQLFNFLKNKFAFEIVAIRILIKVLGDMFNWLWVNKIKPLWDGMRNFASWLKGTFSPLINGILDVIGKVSGFIGSVFSGIGNARSSAANSLARAAGVTPVNDFILRPNGQLLKTNPQDTIIGTKGGMPGVVVNINGPIQGVSAEEISKALSDELSGKVTL